MNHWLWFLAGVIVGAVGLVGVGFAVIWVFDRAGRSLDEAVGK